MSVASLVALVSLPEQIEDWADLVSGAWRYLQAHDWLGWIIFVGSTVGAVLWWHYWGRRIQEEEAQRAQEVEASRRQAKRVQVQALKDAVTATREVWSEVYPLLRKDEASPEHWEKIQNAVRELEEPMNAISGEQRISYERAHAVLEDRLRAQAYAASNSPILQMDRATPAFMTGVKRMLE